MVISNNEDSTYLCKNRLQFLNICNGEKIEEKKVFSSIFIKIKEKTVIFKEKMVIFIVRLPTFSTWKSTKK